MASEKLFQDIPPFPEDIPTAELPTISLSDLRAQEPSAVKSMFDACQRVGFFQLDLRSDDIGEAIIQEIEKTWDVMIESLGLSDDIKWKYHMEPPREILGFKTRGMARTETNQPDRYDCLNISRDGLLGTVPLQPLPNEVLDHRSLLASLMQHGQQIVSLISETLAVQLDLPRSTFTSLQDPSKPSGTLIRFIKAAASLRNEDMRTNLVQHTDFGTITLLANVLGGLQVLTPGRDAEDPTAWLYTRPRPGCLIVNLGDAMVQWTGGVLRSNCHRVTYSPGEQRFVDRLSLAMLFRPEMNASMKKLVCPKFAGYDAHAHDVDDDDNLTALEWETRMVTRMRTGDYVPRSKGGKMHRIARAQVV